ncbi:MAG: hypothetical protein CMJ59_10575 [Planctomycetaceae bacterium]|nr:hypothetical protein [Planctomycetaceae bacterium]
MFDIRRGADRAPTSWSRLGSATIGIFSDHHRWLASAVKLIYDETNHAAFQPVSLSPRPIHSD